MTTAHNYRTSNSHFASVETSQNYKAVIATAAILFVGLLCMAGKASAITIVSTFESRYAIGSGGRIDEDIKHAAEFSTDGSAYSLTDAVAVVKGTMPIYASLYDDANGLPGNEIYVFDSVSGVGGTYQPTTFSAANPFVLQPNTTYHLVIDSPGIHNGGWSNAQPFTTVGPGSAPEQREVYSTSLIFEEGNVTEGPPIWKDLNDSGLAFAINGTAIPEPSTAALFALGMAGCVLVRRRSRSIS